MTETVFTTKLKLLKTTRLILIKIKLRIVSIFSLFFYNFFFSYFYFFSLPSFRRKIATREIPNGIFRNSNALQLMFRFPAWQRFIFRANFYFLTVDRDVTKFKIQ